MKNYPILLTLDEVKHVREILSLSTMWQTLDSKKFQKTTKSVIKKLDYHLSGNPIADKLDAI